MFFEKKGIVSKQIEKWKSRNVTPFTHESVLKLLEHIRIISVLLNIYVGLYSQNFLFSRSRLELQELYLAVLVDVDAGLNHCSE